MTYFDLPDLAVSSSVTSQIALSTFLISKQDLSTSAPFELYPTLILRRLGLAEPII
jgi:hypothetical protein